MEIASLGGDSLLNTPAFESMVQKCVGAIQIGLQHQRCSIIQVQFYDRCAAAGIQLLRDDLIVTISHASFAKFLHHKAIIVIINTKCHVMLDQAKAHNNHKRTASRQQQVATL